MFSKNLQQGTAVFLLTYTFFAYLFKPDWWIYGWLSGLSGILLLWNEPKSPYWRFLTSIAIIFGTLETVFLCWTVRHVEKAALIEGRNKLAEGRSIIITGIATMFTISSRIRHSTYTGLLDFTRVLVLLAALLLMVPVVIYSTCFCVQQLPHCHLFH